MLKIACPALADPDLSSTSVSTYLFERTIFIPLASNRSLYLSISAKAFVLISCKIPPPFLASLYHKYANISTISRKITPKACISSATCCGISSARERLCQAGGLDKKIREQVSRIFCEETHKRCASVGNCEQKVSASFNYLSSYVLAAPVGWVGFADKQKHHAHKIQLFFL